MGNVDIKKFTSSVAVFLLNAIAETIEFKFDEKRALDHIYSAFDNLAITMEQKHINIRDFDNDDEFIKKAALSLLILVNDDEATWEDMKERYKDLTREFIDSERDILKMERHELENIGFAFWNESDPLMLVPVWIYRLLNEDTILTSINGDKEQVFSNKIGVGKPAHIRFGRLAWGFYLE